MRVDEVSALGRDNHLGRHAILIDAVQRTGNVRLEQGKTRIRAQQKATAAATSSARRVTQSIRRHAASSKRVFQTALQKAEAYQLKDSNPGHHHTVIPPRQSHYAIGQREALELRLDHSLTRIGRTAGE